MLVNCFIKRYLTFLLVLFMIDLKKLIDGLLISNRGGRKILLKLIEGGRLLETLEYNLGQSYDSSETSFSFHKKCIAFTCTPSPVHSMLILLLSFNVDPMACSCLPIAQN